MRKTELIAKYALAQLNRAELEVEELQRRMRFRRIDVNDTYELQYALVRLEMAQQFNKDICALLTFGRGVQYD